MAVDNTASSTGINRQNAGKSIVPRPKPEKKVNMEAPNETNAMIK